MKSHQNILKFKSGISLFWFTVDYGICTVNYGMFMGCLRVFDFQVLNYYGICLGRIWEFMGRIWEFMGRIWDFLIVGQSPPHKFQYYSSTDSWAW